MKAKQSKIPRALATGTRLACADNTGARTVQIISVFGYHGVRRRQPKLGLGDICTASVQKGTPDMRKSCPGGCHPPEKGNAPPQWHPRLL